MPATVALDGYGGYAELEIALARIRPGQKISGGFSLLTRFLPQKNAEF